MTYPMSPEVENARNFAILAHGEQKYGKKPYVYHLDHVAQVLNRFGYTAFHEEHNGEMRLKGDPRYLQLAYLHDVFEDTKASLSDIETFFDLEMSTWVNYMSNLEEADKENTFKRIAKTPITQQVKIADRIANMEASLAENRLKLLDKYCSEFELFSKYLALPGVPIWDWLDTLNEIAKDRLYSQEGSLTRTDWR